MEEKIKILYAEDDADFASDTRTLLNRSGFEVKIARNGNEAWAMYLKEKPDLLLLDVDMPGKDGLELIKLVKKRDEILPVIIYSAHAEPSIAIEATKQGVEDYINKDCDEDLFIAKLKNIFRRTCGGQKKTHVIEITSKIFFNYASEVLIINGIEKKMNSKDACLLKLLSMRINEWADGAYLSEGMWNVPDKIEALKKYILHLRKILEQDPSASIDNKWGGYYCLRNRES